MVQRRNGLQTHVVHAQNIRREDREPDQNHHPFKVDGITDVRSPFRHQPRGVENGRRRFKRKRVILFQLTFGKVRFYFSKRCFKPISYPSCSMRVNTSRNTGPYSYLPGQT